MSLSLIFLPLYTLSLPLSLKRQTIKTYLKINKLRLFKNNNRNLCSQFRDWEVQFMELANSW